MMVWQIRFVNGYQEATIQPHWPSLHDCFPSLGTLNGYMIFITILKWEVDAIDLLSFTHSRPQSILGDPGADSGGEGKSKRAEKYGTKKSKERREEPLGTMSYQTSSKRSPPFWLLIGARKFVFFRKRRLLSQAYGERALFELSKSFSEGN